MTFIEYIKEEKVSNSFIKQTAEDYAVSTSIVKDLLKKVDNDKIKLIDELEILINKK